MAVAPEQNKKGLIQLFEIDWYGVTLISPLKPIFVLILSNSSEPGGSMYMQNVRLVRGYVKYISHIDNKTLSGPK
jgi:hypothetical protein